MKKGSLVTRALGSFHEEYSRLTLAELSSAAGTMESVLLAFFHAGIAGEETVRTKRLEVFFANSAQGPAPKPCE